MFFLYKIVNGLAPKCLTNYLNTNGNPVHKTRASESSDIKRFGTRIESLKQSFFVFCVNEWYKLHISLWKAKKN